MRMFKDFLKIAKEFDAGRADFFDRRISQEQMNTQTSWRTDWTGFADHNHKVFFMLFINAAEKEQ